MNLYVIVYIPELEEYVVKENSKTVKKMFSTIYGSGNDYRSLQKIADRLNNK